ncbi:uncharacterized protein Bfra_000759 [Botrytis fragariae]|uniref:Uncharacterized protein n=1 Tax=Botrytis fragariae TaxID=1964551 RepID=A0A8H6B402_9HELO|nr:uncharacterized protein Bfra_000759 [Botrytis fragariae]KAF5878592.1 hypothetical protein Bfra_000759 [Botrytis fragariae]
MSLMVLLAETSHRILPLFTPSCNCCIGSADLLEMKNATHGFNRSSIFLWIFPGK